MNACTLESHQAFGKSRAPSPSRLCFSLSAGEELYLIPGIDMMNHTCMSKACNTSLQRSGPAGCVPVAAQVETSGASPASRGVPCFVMHAGEAFTHFHDSILLWRSVFCSDDVLWTLQLGV